jgi:3-dehydroquinate dehydratase-2
VRRVELLHGVNLDQLGRREPEHYGAFTLPELEAQVAAWGRELGVEVACFQTNHEGAYVERLHATGADGLLLNPGAWTHYAWAIHDALKLTRLPAVEVHLSDVAAREPWRGVSVVRDLCLATVSGKGPEGYREALARLEDALR